MLHQLQQNLPVLTPEQRAIPQLRWVDRFSRLLDTSLRIPGTGIRFGLDFLLGLFPVVGSLLGLAFSGLLVGTMARHGASGRLVLRMLFNVGLDALVGMLPMVGNVFDLFYKANYRNLLLLQQYYGQGRHRGRAWPVLLAVLAVIVLLMVVGLWFFACLIRALLQIGAAG